MRREARKCGRVAGGCGATHDDDGLAVAQLSVDLLSRDT
jgi:hypothetical protein